MAKTVSNVGLHGNSARGMRDNRSNTISYVRKSRLTSSPKEVKPALLPLSELEMTLHRYAQPRLQTIQILRLRFLYRLRLQI